MQDVEKADSFPYKAVESAEDLGTNSTDKSIDTDVSESVGVQVPVIEPTIEPAPPYGLLNKVKAAKRDTGNDWMAFIFQFIIILFSSVYAIIFLAITVVIPIAMIAIGSIFLKDCPRERYIPIYLVVGGCFGVITQLLRIGRQLVQRDDEDRSARPHPLEGLLSCFLFAWFIAGNVWVYRIHGDFTTEDPLAADYCHPTVYWFTFWLITATYILIAAGCCSVCLCGICIAMMCRSATS